MPLIVFSHANSFPASTYGVLFRSLRARGYTVRAIEKLGHDPRFPVTSNWPHLVQQLAQFTQTQMDEHGGQAYLVGHSLGGYLSLMTACLHPQLARGVLLLDSPILSGWRANALALAKHSGLVGSFSPGAVSQRRRNRWPGAAQALLHFQSKKAFTRWDPQVLRDYVEHATHDEADERVLSFDRAVETAIYNNFPHNLGSMLRRHPPPCPVAYLGASESAEMKQVGMAMTHRVTQGRVTLMPGTHLFPMEAPLATAAAIDATLAPWSALAPRT